MVSVEHAQELLRKTIPSLATVLVPVRKSSGFVLAEDVYSKVDVPLFDQSAVDGFAICDPTAEPGAEPHFLLEGEIKAGDTPVRKMMKGSATRIFTGAAVPQNAFCVVMQEHAILRENKVVVPKEFLKENSHIRKKGNQLRKGQVGLKKGTLLTPAAIGFLSAIGLVKVKVFSKPSVGILTTGNELRKPGTKLKPGQIFESNSATLQAALEQFGFGAFKMKMAADDPTALKAVAGSLLKSCDVVIISGGISVGKYDFVKETLLKIGVKELFHKVSQKPGKPLFVGTKGKKIVFAVPGNPAAALVCFYEYIVPTLHQLSGQREAGLKKVSLPLRESFSGKGERSLFLKAKTEDGGVRLLEGQDSDNLQSFARANALVYLKAPDLEKRAGEIVEVHLIPGL